MSRARTLKSGRMFLCLMIVFSLFLIVCIRLMFIMLPAGAAEAAEDNSSISVSLATLRGTIYDRRFLPLTDSEDLYYVCAIPTEQAVISLTEALPQADLDTALERLEDGKPAAVTSDEPITGTGITSVKLTKRYSGTASHIIGYLDSDGQGVAGIEKDFNDILYYGVSAKIRYSVSADGSILPGVTPEIVLPETADNGVVLTLDREIQQVCETAAEEISSGAIVVTDVNTGEIVAMVSRPDYSQTDVAASLNDESSPLLNRALCTYNVGSVFKPLVTAAALESGVSEDTRFTCTGSLEVGGRVFSCHKADGHGDLGFSEAISLSCNVFFYNLSGLFDMRNLLTMCQNLGLDSSIALSTNIVSQSGTLPQAQDLTAPAAAANFAIGQGDLMLTPLHIASIYNTIANDGVYVAPSLIQGTILGGAYTENEQSEGTRIMSAKTAAKIREYLTLTVESGTGVSAKPDTVTAAGKTATAQTGWSSDDGVVDQAWFAGFFPAEDPQYTVVVLVEDGKSGSADCAPIFKEIADGITATGR